MYLGPSVPVFRPMLGSKPWIHALFPTPRLWMENQERAQAKSPREPVFSQLKNGALICIYRFVYFATNAVSWILSYGWRIKRAQDSFCFGLNSNFIHVGRRDFLFLIFFRQEWRTKRAQESFCLVWNSDLISERAFESRLSWLCLLDSKSCILNQGLAQKHESY